MEIKLRKATKKDCRFIWLIRNSLEIRNVCLVKGKILYSNHVEFFTKNLNTYRIIEIKKEKLGYLRYEDGGYIAIHLKKSERNKGLGTQILKKEKGKAIILFSNNQSIRSFTKSGFEIKGFYLEKN